MTAHPLSWGSIGCLLESMTFTPRRLHLVVMCIISGHQTGVSGALSASGRQSGRYKNYLRVQVGTHYYVTLSHPSIVTTIAVLLICFISRLNQC